MLLNHGVREDSWEPLGLQVDQTNLSIKKVSPEYSLEGLMLKLKLQYFVHLMWRTDSLERTDSQPWCWETLKAGREGDDRGSMVGWHHWLSEHNFKQALWVADGLGMLVCCIPWDRKEWDTTERLYWTELWYWMVCLWNEQRSFFHFWDCIQVLHIGLFVDYESYSISSKGYIPWDIVKIQCSKYNHGVTQNEISASSGLNWSAGTGEGRIMRWWKRK